MMMMMGLLPKNNPPYKPSAQSQSAMSIPSFWQKKALTMRLTRFITHQTVYPQFFEAEMLAEPGHQLILS
jgi:hypothetical protein